MIGCSILTPFWRFKNSKCHNPLSILITSTQACNILCVQGEPLSRMQSWCWIIITFKKIASLVGIKLCTLKLSQEDLSNLPTLGPYNWSDKSILRPWSLFLSEVLNSRSQILDLFNANQKCFLASSSNDTYEQMKFIREKEEKDTIVYP